MTTNISIISGFLGAGKTTFTEVRSFTKQEMEQIPTFLRKNVNGYILRAKGIVQVQLDTVCWVSFQFTPHHFSWEILHEAKEAKVVVIGSGLNKQKITEMFCEVAR